MACSVVAQQQSFNTLYLFQKMADVAIETSKNVGVQILPPTDKQNISIQYQINIALTFGYDSDSLSDSDFLNSESSNDSMSAPTPPSTPEHSDCENYQLFLDVFKILENHLQRCINEIVNTDPTSESVSALKNLREGYQALLGILDSIAANYDLSNIEDTPDFKEALCYLDKISMMIKLKKFMEMELFMEVIQFLFRRIQTPKHYKMTLKSK